MAGGSTTDRDTLLRAVLRALGDVLGDVDAARAAYRERCSTLGRRVRLQLPGDTSVEGVAEEVDDVGRLVVAGRAYGAGDVVHLRAAGQESLEP
jgi:BirA family biotin operon repressor/biotin-[acetyl-CoA-carboxylase] ligase